jgi:hypothetical protein
VFSAEAIPSGGKNYHKKCATCAACENQLTFNTVFDGGDKVRERLKQTKLGIISGTFQDFN